MGVFDNLDRYGKKTKELRDGKQYSNTAMPFYHTNYYKLKVLKKEDPANRV